MLLQYVFHKSCLKIEEIIFQHNIMYISLKKLLTFFKNKKFLFMVRNS